MYHTIRYVVKESHPLHAYFGELAHLTNNLHNATLFRIRQVLSAVGKDTPTPNEQEVLNEIKAALPVMNETRAKANAKRRASGKPESAPFEMPAFGTSFLSYPFLDAFLGVGNHYFCFYVVIGDAHLKSSIVWLHLYLLYLHLFRYAASEIKHIFCAREFKHTVPQRTILIRKRDVPHAARFTVMRNLRLTKKRTWLHFICTQSSEVIFHIASGLFYNKLCPILWSFSSVRHL